MANELDFVNFLENNEELKPIMDAVQQIIDLDDEKLNPEATAELINVFNQMFTPEIKENFIFNLLQSFRERRYTKKQINEYIENLNNGFDLIIDSFLPTPKQRVIISAMFNMCLDIIKEAAQHYQVYDIELPIKFLNSNAHMPIYAHDTDAAADLYAAETITIPAHSYGNMVSTGIAIALPVGWKAHIAPRSSIGVKTPLRLSNSLGVIDADYRGEIKIIFDNTSNSDYTINAGDRIAQLWVSPIYTFKGIQVENLDETERNDGGFGSTGK